jgi:serine/threonine protein kinase
MVQEYIDGFPLSYYIVKGKRFNEKEVMVILQQLLEILAYLHEPEEKRSSVVHRDLRLSNLIWHDGKVYLIDFGFALYWNGKYEENEDFFVNSDIRMNCRCPGTETYKIFRNDVSPKSDLFGTGVVGLELFSSWIEDEKLFQKPWQEILPASNSYKLFIERLLEPAKEFRTARDALKAIS